MACSGEKETTPPATATATPAAVSSAADAPIPPTTSPYDALPEAVRLVMDKPFTGDFDALVARRAIRVAVTFNRTHYFIDQGQERGLTYEALKLFENDLNDGPEDRQPQGARGDRADVARSAVPRPRERQGGHGRGHGDRHDPSWRSSSPSRSRRAPT